MPSQLTLDTLEYRTEARDQKNIEKMNTPLPHELIEEILLRLPVKPLVRFRSVSKPWCSLISDTQFSKSHFDLAAAPNDKLLYATLSSSEARWVDVHASIRRACAVVQLPIPYDFDLTIIGSCRGFILSTNYRHLILWNPSTGFHKPLSYSPIASNVLRSGLYKTIHFWCGFGYDTSNDDYLVVIGWHELRETVELETHLEFFSVRTNSWRRIEGIHFPYRVSFVEYESGVFFNGAIHWLAAKQGHARANGLAVEVIIAFDLVEKNLSEIPLPDRTGRYFDHLKLLGGCLGVCYTEGNNAEIWVMKEYNVQSSWTKHNIVLPFSVSTSTSTPLYLTKGGELVATNDRGHLVKFNDKGKLVEIQLDNRDVRTMVMFTETLLSLPCDFGETREDDG